MNVECQLNQLRGLIQLLRVEDDENDSDTDYEDPIMPARSSVGPASVKPNPTPKTDDVPKEPSPYAKLEDETGAWEEREQQEMELNLPQPEFKISYKQAVTTEDLYLGMGNKGSSTASCEDIVLEIRVPEETVGIDEMTLNVTEKEVHFESPRYKTRIPLPHPVDPNKGKAVFNADHRVIKLTLRMRREMDFVNF